MLAQIPDSSRSRSLLVCEEEGLSLMQLCRAAQLAGLRVVGEAVDAEKAVEIARIKRPGIVVLGIESSALEKAVRSLRRACPTCLLVVSGYARENPGENSRLWGADRCLTKPFDRERLVTFLRETSDRFADDGRIEIPRRNEDGASVYVRRSVYLPQTAFID